MNPSARISAEYLRLLQPAFFQQALVLLASGLLLDSPRANLLVLTAMGGHALAMVLVMVRRPAAPTRLDVLLFRFGFVPTLAVTVALALLLWQIVVDETLFEKWFARSLVPEPSFLLPLFVAAGIWVILFPILRVSGQRRGRGR